MTRMGIGVWTNVGQGGGGWLKRLLCNRPSGRRELSRVYPASAIIRARGRVIGPVKIGPFADASSAGVSVHAPG